MKAPMKMKKALAGLLCISMVVTIPGDAIGNGLVVSLSRVSDFYRIFKVK